MDWSSIISEQGWSASSTVELESREDFKANLPQTWFDSCIPSPLPEYDKSAAVEYLHKVDDDVVAIRLPPVVITMEEKLDYRPRTPSNEKVALIERLSRRFNPQNVATEIDRECNISGNFNTETILTGSVVSKHLYGDKFPQSEILLCDLLDSKPRALRNCVVEIKPEDLTSALYDQFPKLPFTFEIPGTCDWSLLFYGFLDRSSFAKIALQTQVEDLPDFRPSGSFESLVLMPELRLSDRKFSSLPLPVLKYVQSDRIDISLVILTSLEFEPATGSATDRLYLDWHFFHGAKCTSGKCFELRERWNDDIQCATAKPDFQSGRLDSSRKCTEHVLKLLDNEVLHRDTGVCLRASLKKANEIKTWYSPLPEKFSQAQPTEESEQGGFQAKGDTPVRTGSATLLSSCTNSCAEVESRLKAQKPELQPMALVSTTRPKPGSQTTSSKIVSSDLDYFMQHRQGFLSKKNTKDTVEEMGTDSKCLADLPNCSPSSSTALSADKSDKSDNTVKSPASAFCEHIIELPAEIRKCVVSLASDYYTILASEEMNETKSIADQVCSEDFGFDADGNTSLANLISRVASDQASCQRQAVLRCLTALHILRQTTLNLCTYGIQVAHLYLENFFSRIIFLEGFIVAARIELEEAYDQVERGVLEDHPKLHFIARLLRPLVEIEHDKPSSKKILLVAEKRVFFTLVRKLVSLGLTPYQIDRKDQFLQNGYLRVDSAEKLKREILEALTFSNCLLVPNTYMNPAVPVERFTMIIEYADFSNIRRLDSHWTNARYRRHVFKIMMHPDDFRKKSTKSFKSFKETCHYQQVNNSTGSTGYGIGQQVEVKSSVEDQCDTIIVTNIGHSYEHTLTGRRSSYQKVLHLEKENDLQIVERELRLPVDLILSPSSCLVIYTIQKLKLEGQEIRDKQDIFRTQVDNQMKAISFSFQDCILVFEGSTEFTSVALEFLDDFHALAFALEMQIRCFLSRHADVTDLIVRNSIDSVRRWKQMPLHQVTTESATLAEAFLTEFPSINPLSAHAILSSGWTLPAFISLEHQQQLGVVERYKVPVHCLKLFKVQCAYKAMNTVVRPGLQSVDSDTLQFDTRVRRVTHISSDDQPGLSSLNSDGNPASEVWRVFPEFPPASAVLNDASASENDQSFYRYPDFPFASEVVGVKAQASVGKESEHEKDSEVAWRAVRSEKEDKTKCLRRANNFSKGMRWTHRSSKPGYKSTHLRAMPVLYAPDTSLSYQRPTSYLGVAIHRQESNPNHSLIAANESNSLGGLQANLCGGQELRLDLADTPQLEQNPWSPESSKRSNSDNRNTGVKRCSSSSPSISPTKCDGGERFAWSSPTFSSMSPTEYDGRERFAWTCPTFSSISPTEYYGGQKSAGSACQNDCQNDKKRVRSGLPEGFLDESLDIMNIDECLLPASSTFPFSVDGFLDPLEQRGEANPFDTFVHHRPETTRKPTLDRFRFQHRGPARGTTSDSRKQATFSSPRITPKLQKMKSSNTMRRKFAGKPAVAMAAVGDVRVRGAPIQESIIWRR